MVRARCSQVGPGTEREGFSSRSDKTLGRQHAVLRTDRPNGLGPLGSPFGSLSSPRKMISLALAFSALVLARSLVARVASVLLDDRRVADPRPEKGQGEE